MHSHDILRDFVGPCYISYLPQRSRNGPKIGILKANRYARPSKTIWLGRVLSQKHASMCIKTEALHRTLRSS